MQHIQASAGRRPLSLRLPALAPLCAARWRLQLAACGGLHLRSNLLLLLLLLLRRLRLLLPLLSLLPAWRPQLPALRRLLPLLLLLLGRRLRLLPLLLGC